MSSIDRGELRGDVEALRAVVSGFLGRSYGSLTTAERFGLLEVFEREVRRLQSVSHQLINLIGEQADSTELGGRLSWALAERLHISRAQAGRRIAVAAELGPRRALSGESLPAVLAATAAAQRGGAVGAEHVAVIRRFFHQLPEAVDIETREHAEKQLAGRACEFRPEQLEKLARRLMDCLNPDGRYTEEDRARVRGLMLGNQ